MIKASKKGGHLLLSFRSEVQYAALGLKSVIFTFHHRLTEYISGLEMLEISQECLRLSTGSPELDELIGGVQRGLFYLFYGKKSLIEPLFQHMTVQGLADNERGKPTVVYMLLGNYRKERTNLGLEELAELIEDSGFHMWEALKRVQVFTASSADQQVLLVEGLIRLLMVDNNVSLVIVRGIYKLAKDDPRQRNRHVVYEEVQSSINHLRRICAERGIPIVASGRDSNIKNTMKPLPESSLFLRHCANIIVYLRGREKSSKYNRAFLIDHPFKPLGSVEYHYVVDYKMGRETKPFRMSYQEMIDRLRKEFKEPLRSENRRTAFEMLIQAWSDELGAMSYAESFKILDLMLMTSTLENRSILENIRKQLEEIVTRINHLEDASM